jgi:hypothetical protein
MVEGGGWNAEVGKRNWDEMSEVWHLKWEIVYGKGVCNSDWCLRIRDNL